MGIDTADVSRVEVGRLLHSSAVSLWTLLYWIQASRQHSYAFVVSMRYPVQYGRRVPKHDAYAYSAASSVQAMRFGSQTVKVARISIMVWPTLLPDYTPYLHTEHSLTFYCPMNSPRRAFSLPANLRTVSAKPPYSKSSI